MNISKAFHGITKHLTLIIFVTLYIILALFTYKDFGITWDEFVVYNRGVASYELMFKKLSRTRSNSTSKTDTLILKKFPIPTLHSSATQTPQALGL